MVEDTFPASDATQLPGRAAHVQPENAASGSTSPNHGKDEHRPSAPRTIGNQGVIPASRSRKQTIPLGDAHEVTLRLDPAQRTLELLFSDPQLALDAAALDRLIKALSMHRTRMAQ